MRSSPAPSEDASTRKAILARSWKEEKFFVEESVRKEQGKINLKKSLSGLIEKRLGLDKNKRRKG